MSFAARERASIEELDFVPEVPCDCKTCSAAAEWAIRGVCGCVDLECGYHMTQLLENFQKILPCIIYCSKHPGFPDLYCTKVGDIIKSVRPL
jgi:hypothetical protein